MQDMDYDSLIEQTKKALDSYSSVNTELEVLYKKAKENYTAGFNLAKQQLGEQYTSDKNTAVTKGKLDEKDMHQFLASRGLSSSGESVQAKIDSNISINNSLSALAKENVNALTSLEQKRFENDSKLETDFGNKKIEFDKWNTELATKIAEIKNNSSKSGNSGGKGSSGKGSDPTDKIDSDNEQKKPYVPETSTKELAKNLIATYSPNGNITTILQKSYIKKYINSLSKTENVDSDYIKELIINLKAVGYTDITDQVAEANIAVDISKSFYNDFYEQYYDIYIRGNKTSEHAERLAKAKAKTLMLDNIYQHCSTIDSFEKACKLSDVTNKELEEYYKRINNIIDSNGKSITLGSKVSR